MNSAAETLLLILAANGGEMSKADAQHEFDRVMALPPSEYAIWRHNVQPLVRAHALLRITDDVE